MTHGTVKLSKAVQRELDRTAGSRVVIAALLTITSDEFCSYKDLGLRCADGRIETGEPALPPPTLGHYARRNIEGWEDRLDHDGFIVGKGRFARYFGAKFGSRLVALENLEYGNALYAFEANWEQLTQLSRTELIRRRDPSVHRIPHVPGWQSAIRKLVRAR